MTLDKENSGAAVLRLSHEIYKRALVLYRRDLRQEFGAEMIEVFDEQLSEAYLQRGVTGLLRIWCYATGEFFRIALPGQVAERIVPAVAIAAVLGLMLWFAGYISYVMKTACGSCGH